MKFASKGVKSAFFAHYVIMTSRVEPILAKKKEKIYMPLSTSSHSEVSKQTLVKLNIKEYKSPLLSSQMVGFFL